MKIVTYVRDRVNQFSDRYQHNYSVLATPAEGLSGKFTRKDREKFGSLPGITDRDYYTNSNYVPVYYKCSARHKAEVEAPYHDLTRGGHIFYVEMDGDATHNPEAIMRVVDMMDYYNIGYGSVNHNRNRCVECGYENAAKSMEACPKCGSTHIDRLQRILADPFADVTFTGGDPMAQAEGFTELAKAIKAQSNKNIWCYTGYTFEELLTRPACRELLNYIDVLVDGRFVQALRDESLRFRGSSNQRIVDVPTSLRTGEVVSVPAVPYNHQ